MENKKLLKYLLKDLSELEELLVDRDDFNFDEVEIEFIQTRVRGAKKLVQMYLDYPAEPVSEVKHAEPEKPVIVEVIKPAPEKREEFVPPVIQPEPVKRPVFIQHERPKSVESEKIPEPQKKVEEIIETKQEPRPAPEVSKIIPGALVSELVDFIEDTIADIDIGEKIKANEPIHEIEDIRPESEPEDKKGKKTKQAETEKAVQLQQEIKLEEEANDEPSSRTLADKFSNEKSLNDIVSSDQNKLEHKLSNLPVTSIQAAIGINDRFQYVRELFNGNSELYNKTVTELDSMNNLKEAVAYLQGNFKWKKNEISLKFVNLLKRRFPQ